MKKLTILASVLLAITLLVSGPAMADVIDNFMGFPTPDPFTQQDKDYADFSLTVPAVQGLTTSIKTQTFLLPTPYDVHTVTFSGVFSQATTYDFQYSITVNDPNLEINKIGVGISQSFGTTAATVQKFAWVDNWGGTNLVYNSGLVTGNAPDFTFIPPYSKLYIMDRIITNNSIVNSISNSFTETVATVPEPALLILLGFGLVGVAGLRRKFSK